MKFLRTVLATIISFVVLLIAFQEASADGHNAESAIAAAPAKDEKPLPQTLQAKMRALDIDPAAPIYMRAFKEEGLIEVWKQSRSGNYCHLADYTICAWSGRLGPKLREGDHQTPEGFYPVSFEQMHPKSRFHLAFNLGFPNLYDQANGHTGSFLMVHGNCLSVGCFAMRDEKIEEIYAFAREAFAGGQKTFRFDAFPFRMNGQNMARYYGDANMAFWAELKPAYDLFEIRHIPPRIEICDKSYVVTPQADTRQKQKLCQSGGMRPIDPVARTYRNSDYARYLVGLYNPIRLPPAATHLPEHDNIKRNSNDFALLYGNFFNKVAVTDRNSKE